MTYLCGLYRVIGELPYFVILTRQPGESIRFIHDRMPLILPEEYIDDWIKPDSVPEDIIGNAITDPFFGKYQRYLKIKAVLDDRILAIGVEILKT